MPKSKNKNRSKSKSGYFGVKKITNGDKYEATIKIDGKYKNLGSSYDTAKQAAKAYDKEAIRLRKPLSSLNFPERAPVGYKPIRQPLQSRNTTGYRGVSKRGKKFKNNYHDWWQKDKHWFIRYSKRSCHRLRSCCSQSQQINNFIKLS